MRKRTRSREIALQILYQISITHDSSEDALKSFWQENEEDKEIREFTEALIRGTTGHTEELDTVITKYAEHWDISRMAIVDLNILRLAAYELLHASDIPPKVSINEAVNLAKKFSQEDSGKFVNGILDRISHSEPLAAGKQ